MAKYLLEDYEQGDSLELASFRELVGAVETIEDNLLWSAIALMNCGGSMELNWGKITRTD